MSHSTTQQPSLTNQAAATNVSPLDSSSANQNDISQNQKTKTKIADFRNSILHLERIYHTDRHAGANDKEKLYWSTIAYRFLAETQAITCARAKPDDLARQSRIIDLVSSYLNEHFPKNQKPIIGKSYVVIAGGFTGEIGKLRRGAFPKIYNLDNGKNLLLVVASQIELNE